MLREPTPPQKTIKVTFAGILLLLFVGSIILPSTPEQAVSAMNPLDLEETSTPTSTSTLTPIPTFTPTPLTGLSLVSWSSGCTTGPYITCSASVTDTHTDPYRWDFDITYNYNDNRTNFGSTFSLKLRFATGVFYTGVPIYWNMYPIENEVMPSRRINVLYAVASDLDSMEYPSGTWTIPAQPIPYDKFEIIFSRTTSNPEILVRTDKWHLTLSTYPNIATATETPTLTLTNTLTSTPTPTNTPTGTPTATVGTWYTGNSRTGAYGVKAVISAPQQVPYLESFIGNDGGEKSGESSWVSIPGPLPWVQVGWKYYYNYPDSPKKYLEWYLPNIPPGENQFHDFHYFGNQDWGTTEEYYIIWGGGTIWCGQVGNNYLECFDTEQKYAPITVLAYSEVHASSNNELNTYFSQVYYFSANGWELFDQARWQMDSPYMIDQTHNYEYRNYGP